MLAAILANCRNTNLLGLSSEKNEDEASKRAREHDQELGKVWSKGFRLLRPHKLRLRITLS